MGVTLLDSWGGCEIFFEELSRGHATGQPFVAGQGRRDMQGHAATDGTIQE